jgi:hypothetical protein
MQEMSRGCSTSLQKETAMKVVGDARQALDNEGLQWVDRLLSEKKEVKDENSNETSSAADVIDRTVIMGNERAAALLEIAQILKDMASLIREGENKNSKRGVR